MTKIKSLTAVVVLTLLLSAVFAGCSGSYKSSPGYNSGGEVIITDNAYSLGTGTGSKIAYEARVNIESENTLETAGLIKDKIGEYASAEGDNSRVNSTESMLSSDRYSLTIRVTAAKLDEFLDYVDGLGNVLQKSVTSEDLNKSYNDFSANKTALEAERDLLLGAIDALGPENADKFVEYSMRLTAVNTELNKINIAMGNIDDRVELSTVYINIYYKGTAPAEEKYTSLVARIFIQSWKAVGKMFRGLSVAVVAITPFAIVGGAIAAVAVVPAVMVSRKKKAGNDKTPDDKDKNDGGAA